MSKSEHTLTPQEWQENLSLFDNRCAYCGASGVKLEQEHMVPVVAGGGYTQENIIPACRSCNARKRSSTIADFLFRLDVGEAA
jgi:5-methylcytosine-specific restriction endonuclease McrA